MQNLGTYIWSKKKWKMPKMIWILHRCSGELYLISYLICSLLRKNESRDCVDLRWFDEFFFFFSIFSFCTWTRSCHYFCEIFSSVLKVSCCRIYLEITTIWWVRRLKIWYFFLGKRWTSRTVQDQTPNWSFRAQCTQHQTANEPRGTLAEASKELPHNKTACCSTLRYWRWHTGQCE